MQADGTWTWDAFEEVLAKVQRDTNNDGVIDVYGVTQNASNLTNALVWSNNAEYVGKESDGTFTYKLENPETLAALEEAVKIFNDYSLPYPDGANWDYYKEAYLNGEAVFLTDDVYCAGDFLSNMEDDFGFVMFPKGPNATDYTNCWSNNPVAIPACYDADKAWKIAFAWNLYTDDVPGYEDYEGWRPGYYANFRDTRSVDESIAPMVTNGFVTYDGVIPNLQRGSDLTWNIGAGTVISETVESIRDTWKSYIDEANSK
jgi:ABC-type glycerol-3-phosphate transport system substrate-binding protein